MAKPRILLVDDDPSLLQVVSLGLGLQGYDVVTASDGSEALRMLQAGEMPQLIISDVMMPEMDGIELCRNVRAIPHLAQVPVFIFTALNAQDDIDRIRAAGATKMITKPFDIVGLASVIRSTLPPAP